MLLQYCSHNFPGNGTEDIVRRYRNHSRLFFFSVHLFEKEETGYEFFPGSGADDDTVRFHDLIFIFIFHVFVTSFVS